VIVVGHIVLFAGRLNFVLVGGIFATVFYVRFEDLQLGPLQILGVVIGLFTMFCYTLDLERIGRRFETDE
jgi:hypothetical protein